jgi:imidazolonepropionase-like amidohydrolase
VGNWADQGATSFKAYTGLGRQALYAAIQVAHARGLKVTGHLCAVGFQDAAAFGIDNLEHGLIVDSEFLPGRTPDVCPDWNDRLGAILAMDVSSPAIRQLISNLVSRRIAVTSTLAIHETLTPKPDVELRTLLMLAPRLQDDYRARHATRLEPKAHEWWARVLKKEMEFERAFVAAGGWLMAGVDPSGGIVAGFGDQRQLELLVEAGFSAEAAIRIATANGAAWLNESRRVGTIAAGLDADLIVVRGDPSRNISDVRNVEVVFKRGVGYDPAKLIASVQGTVGELDVRWALRPPYGPVIGVLVLLLLARRLWLRQTPKRRD